MKTVSPNTKRSQPTSLWLGFLLPGLLFCASATRADVVADWDLAAINATLGGPTFPQTRTLAIMHTAIFEAVNTIDRRYTPYAVDMAAPKGTSAEAAAAAAGHAVLSALVPAQQAGFDNALNASLAKVPDGQAKTDGIAVGKQVAEKILALRANDGFAAKVEFKIPPPGLGVWQLTPQFSQPIQTQWGQMKPMVLKSATQFDPGGPTPLSSEQWVRDYNEVKSLGARNSTTRTAEQTAVAIFWTIQTNVPWHAAARAAAAAKGLDIVDSARLFALMTMAAHDSQIAVIEEKYRYNFWRPYTAIRYAGGAGNSALASDPNWEPIINTPGFPEYPSGHCIHSGAAEQVLKSILGSDQVNVSVTSPPLTGVTRTWSSFSQMAREVEDARVWGGIHYRTSDEHATQTGRKIGEWTVKNFLRQAVTSSAKGA